MQYLEFEKMSVSATVFLLYKGEPFELSQASECGMR